MIAEPQDLRRCAELLPSVSRTFALTIRVLPSDLRDSVTVAYLLCRLADDLEDATWGEPAIRIQGLEGFARVLAETDVEPELLAEALSPADGILLNDPAGRRLVGGRLPVLRAFAGLPREDRRVIARWVQAMALGMSTFVAREGPHRGQDPMTGKPPVTCLQTSEELRSYAFTVAGTVGFMLTELFVRRLGRRLASEERLRELALPFGLGLQFTNILQDVAEDRTRGWSYVPEEIARRHGTSARILDAPEERPAALRVIAELVREAAGYLDRAMEYSLLLPRCSPPLRLFCLWPTFFALRTLVRVWGEERILTGGEKIRISRREVRAVIARTGAACLSDRWLRNLYLTERARLERRMAHEALIL